MADKKLVKMKNTMDRYFNWVNKWGIISVPENEVEFYKRNWFVVIEEVKAIVENKEMSEDESRRWAEDNLTKKGIVEKLKELWVEFDSKAKKEELEKLLESVMAENK